MDTAEIILIVFFTIAISLGINYLVAKSFCEIACQKGHYSKKYFHFCFWLGLPGWIMVAALPDRSHINNVAPQPYTAYSAPAGNQNGFTPNQSFKASNQPKIIREKGTCDFCDTPNVMITKCKIVDDMGTRYRKLCDDCMAKHNAEPTAKA